MDFGLGFISLLLGYLVGSINFARIFTRMKVGSSDFRGHTVEMEDTDETVPYGGFGAGTASSVLGPKYGIIIALLDMLKVIIPMLLIKLLYPGDYYFLFSSFGGLLGHNWPIYYGFKGGRGMSAMLASFLVVDWVGAIISVFAGMFLGSVIFGSPIISYILWMWLMIPWLILRKDSPEVIYSIFMNIFFLLGSVPEMRTMLRLKKSGQYDAFIEGLHENSSRLQLMRKMADRMWILRPIFEKRKNQEIDQSS